mmetsp:Transcript_32868/g.29168  ORF Transcript_32868/g.29168 Transcript_32868/m.29168 type:complete len:96 (+) Transcript_32868:198-485(+)
MNVIKNPSVALNCMCIICRDCYQKDNPTKCPKCNKAIEAEFVSQDIQLLYANINSMLVMNSKSQELLNAIQESNKETGIFANSLMGINEEVKESE